MSEKRVRVRFAPSPTGPLHIGGVRTALYNYLFAKKNKGDFILRIEDTDSNRFVPGAEEYIIEAFKWCGISFDEGVGFKANPEIQRFQHSEIDKILESNNLNHADGNRVPGNRTFLKQEDINKTLLEECYLSYKQSRRKAIYKIYVNRLLAENKAYYAFDKPEEIEILRKELEAAKAPNASYCAQTRMRMKNSLTLSAEEVQARLNSGEPYVIRVKMPENELINANDIIRSGIEVNTSTLDDKVLWKSADGLPTYHMANIVDDHLMQISHVIRGEEWLPSLPLHVLLYRYLGWEESMPLFAHLPLLLKPDGKGKLNKRDGDKMGFPVFPLQWKDPANGEISMGYRESGYLPDAFINILAFLGWNPGTEKELFSLDELVQAFSLERVSKHGARFDFEKAKWFNHQYLQERSNEEIAREFNKVLKEKGIHAEEQFVLNICGLLKNRVNYIKELWDQSGYFFRKPESYDSEIIKKKWTQETNLILKEVAELITGISPYEPETINQVLHQYIESKQLPVGMVMNCLRLSLVGASMGPDLPLICKLLGKKEVINRILLAVEKIKV